MKKGPISLLPALTKPDQSGLEAEPIRKVYAIMMGDTLLLMQKCLRNLDIACVLNHTKSGAALASALLLEDPETWPD